MQMIQYYNKHAKQVNDMHVSTVLGIQILFLTVQKKKKVMVISTPQISKINNLEKKKSHTCEEGGAQLRISFWHLLMNLKSK